MRPPDHEPGCFKCDSKDYSTTHCHSALADSWGYGQPCCLDSGHRGLCCYKRGDGFVIMWGYE